MRIEQLRFQNLNSLVGEWSIDLTDPAYQADGIFAITGPTGAGKSTILDALCLALYGRTPRLASISKSSNEIMSRQTGACFAEVTFSTQSGRYRCHWSQHRARQRVDGDLQIPKHEIADATSGTVLESGLRATASAIEEKTGMDFERFTRSMLLAQGGFAAFLQASADARAPILEEITGTEIYSTISIHVHERTTSEKRRLETLQAELAGLVPLSADEEDDIRRQRADLLHQDAEATAALTAHTQAIDWHRAIAELEQDLITLDAERAQAQAQDDAFAPSRIRLTLATRALELAGDHGRLTTTRHAQQSDSETLDGLRQRLPQLAQAAAQATQAHATARQDLDSARQALSSARPHIAQARAMDRDAAHQRSALTEARSSAAEQATHRANLHAALTAACDQRQTKGDALAALLATLNDRSADQALVEGLSGLRQHFAHQQRLIDERQTLQAQQAKAATTLTEATTQADAHQQALDDQSQVVAATQAALDTLREQREAVLDGQPLSHWRTHLGAQDRHVTQLQALLSRSQLCDKDRAKDQAAAAQEATLTADLAAQAEDRTRLQTEQDHAEREATLLETQLQLLDRIASLEDARHDLRDGSPCPLCGATEHPYAQQTPPRSDDTRSRLATLRDQIKTRSTRLTNLIAALATGQRDLQHLRETRQTLAEAITETTNTITQALALAPSSTPPLRDRMLTEILTERLSQAEQALAQAQTRVGDAETLDQRIQDLQATLSQQTQARQLVEQQAQQARHQRTTAHETVERLAAQERALADQQTTALNALSADLAPYGLPPFSAASASLSENLTRALDHLENRRQGWVDDCTAKDVLERACAQLDHQITSGTHALERATTEAEASAQRCQALEQTLATLLAERHALFGDADPDTQEQALTAAITQAEQVVEQTRTALEARQKAEADLITRTQTTAQTLTERAPVLAAAEAAFLDRLSACGFADEAAFTAAHLPEDQRATLTAQDRALAERLAALRTRIEEKTLLLAAKRQAPTPEQPLTSLPLDDLLTAKAALDEDQRARHQALGALEQRLKANEDLKESQQSRLAAIATQTSEHARWAALHTLIGASDGKKFRNFAQGLTFELMVGHANQQLQRMTDRYILVRDRTSPLDLTVADTYQAGEIRSTKNLSGGESFIVSLALALGLSQMASRTVRVDSLFLDEGFGTLDEDALDTALETLSSLHQDGKLIGIISHVATLKERVSTQIHVTPRIGGRSTLSGPGCQQG